MAVRAHGTLWCMSVALKYTPGSIPVPARILAGPLVDGWVQLAAPSSGTWGGGLRLEWEHHKEHDNTSKCFLKFCSRLRDWEEKAKIINKKEDCSFLPFSWKSEFIIFRERSNIPTPWSHFLIHRDFIGHGGSWPAVRVNGRRNMVCHAHNFSSVLSKRLWFYNTETLSKCI